MQTKQQLRHCIAVAMGQEPADTVFVNGNIVSTFSEEVFAADFAVTEGKIVAVDYIGDAKQVVDLQGAYVCPALIDGHIHIESSMLSPEGFAEIAVPCGTGTVISDPHEIANVFGIRGIEYMLHASKGIPLDIRYTIPSCVPATNMETSGACLGAEDIAKIYQLDPGTPALSELMNYPGVFLMQDEVLEKVMAAQKLRLNIDGHSPMLRGKELNAYLNAGIRTDHECTSVEEARDKLRRGMFVMMREGSAARNLEDLLPLLSDQTAHRICIASDDRHPDQIMEHGYLDRIWRKMIALGIEPIRALRIMTLNPAEIYRLQDRGGLGVGYRADFFTVADLQSPQVQDVYYQGELVARSGKIVTKLPRHDPHQVMSSVTLPGNLHEKLQYPEGGKVRVIGAVAGQLVTEHKEVELTDVAKQDLAYLAVVERHGKNGQVGLGFLSGLGMEKGALASTVAHDNHNLILVGKSTQDMERAAQTAQEMGGGFVVVRDGEVLAKLPLAIAGLMSVKSGHEVAQELHELDEAVKGLGIAIESPFMVLSFLALSVIPSLKLTDMGLVDVEQFRLVPLEVT